MLIYTVFGPLLSLTLHNTACSSPNGSIFDPRTFSGQFVSVHDDPVDYLDLSEFNTEESGSGLGLEQHPVKKQVHHPQKKGHYIVSEQAKEFLQGRLATLFVPTFYILVFFVSVPLNLVAVVMFVRYIRPRKPAVIYMLNLSCADLFYGLLLPFKVSYHYHGNNWIYGDWICRMVTAAFYCNMYCSVLLISCIGIDRFLAVVYPINSLTWRTPRTAISVCISIWLLALVGVAPLLFSTQTVHLPQMDITTCHDVQDTQKLQSYYLYFFPIYATIFFFIPLVLTVVCYVRIVQALTAANVEIKSKKTRAVVMTILVLVMFVVCFTPTNIILMVHYVQLSHISSDSTYQAYLLSLCIGSLSCCLDPLLYYFGSSQCQRQVLFMFRRRRFSVLSSYKTQSTRSSGYNSSIHKVETLGSQYT
ncbi:proteinase-activated receptor 1 [Boleophthalmus pectinirostris]|uniref:proteinase-activated receptor 1 n=1 Tax=Boleophthalmus pectinirostris TaxID=150288 RepID=UPI000A1C5526|nr:proteinase-activated receptor 1 [Boleophthalmus pectinirostris]